MEVAVVYESLFGNTRLVAEAIADGVRAADPAARVSVARTDAAKLADVEDACLLVVGGPTHMMRMSSPRTRRLGQEAARTTQDPQRHEPEPDTGGPGLREWLHALPPGWAAWPPSLTPALNPGWQAGLPGQPATSCGAAATG